MSKSYDLPNHDIDIAYVSGPCECESCRWTGDTSALVRIEGTELTPGDLVPAGRCPECDELAYPRTLPTYAETAIKTALARINGVFDDPGLIAFGPLSTDTLADVRAILMSVTEGS